MSTHATAEVIDVAAMTLSDGRTISLLHDWSSIGPEGAFLRSIQASGCRHFGLVLAPEYNMLHAGHFHTQSTEEGSR